MITDEARLRTLLEPVTAGDDLSESHERLARAAWTVILEPGDGIGGMVLAELGAARALELLLSQASCRTWLEALGDCGLGPREVTAALARWQPRAQPQLIERALLQGARWGQKLVIPGDRHWPDQLDDLGAHAPAALWVRGRTEALATLAGSAALVGARASTAYGSQIAAELAEAAVHRRIPVVSGGAFGIDATAHRVTLAAEGLTVCVLAGGLDRWYPAANSELIERVSEVGVVVAEVPSGVTPTRWRFLQRNRLIAALSAATVVVEAGIRSGAINTAGHAAAIGRPLGAVPGPVNTGTSAGCHRVIREYGAEIVEGAADLERLLHGADSVQPVLADAVGSLEMRLLDALSERAPRPAESLATTAGLSISETLEGLGMLDLAGRAEQRGGGWVKLR